jgi:isocitrate/isopropylmalate dehydrogenase
MSALRPTTDIRTSDVPARKIIAKAGSLLTTAHGSAIDIVGKGVANPGAIRAALLLAAKMGARRVAAKGAR